MFPISGRAVSQLVQYFEPLVQSTIGAASNINNSKLQEQILDQMKSVAESALQLIYATKDCGGNPKVKIPIMPYTITFK